MEKKNLPALIIICLANSVIYTLPFVQSTYYESMRVAYGFTHLQMGNLIGFYGMGNLLAYFFGGIAADSFDTKQLFIFSLTVTGITGIYSATYPPYHIMLLLSVVWSFSTILTFWPASIKAIKSLADQRHQGWVFGIKETLVCLMALIISMAGLWIFNKSEANIAVLIGFYGICHLIVAVLVLFFMPAHKVESKPVLKDLIGGIGKVLKLKGVWLIGSVIFFGTNIGIILNRLTPFLTTVCTIGASGVALITIISTNGFANIGSFSGGKIMDSLGSPAKFLAMTMGAFSVAALLFVVMPWTGETVWLCVAFSVLFRIFNGGLRSAYFATMSQVDIPQNLIGTASGIISIIGYLPDAVGYTVWGAVMERFEPVKSFRIIFFALVVCCILGMVCAIALHKFSKTQKCMTE
ncbi:MAG: MFS transporter [Oscillospiraceae bacterium]